MLNMPAMRKAGYAIAIAATVLAAGCAGNGSLLRQPSVELASAEVTDMSLTSQTFLLGFTVYNPNPFPLPVRGVSYRIRLNDQNFAGGKTAGHFTIPAEGDENFAISVDLDLMRSGARLTSLIRSGLADDFEYELHGDLDLAIPASPTLRFASRGTVAIQAARR